MTPEERNLVTELFDRLATLEDAARDPEAERLIKDGLRQAPNAVYALVQTVLVQDEALKRADARIGELEDELGVRREPPRQSGFLDSMRDALFGSRESERQPAAMGAPRSSTGSVPSVRPSDVAPMAAAAPPRGGSFLGTAASAAAGVIGGSLLLDGIRSMMGQPHGAQAAFNPTIGGTPQTSPPDPNAANTDLARQAGIDDIGRNPDASSSARAQGLFDDAADDDNDNDDNNDNDDDDNDDDDMNGDDDMSNDDDDMDDDDFDDDDSGFGDDDN
jgi:hypothetical protein